MITVTLLTVTLVMACLFWIAYLAMPSNEPKQPELPRENRPRSIVHPESKPDFNSWQQEVVHRRMEGGAR